MMKIGPKVKVFIGWVFRVFFSSHLKVHLRHHYLVHGKLGELPHNIKILKINFLIIYIYIYPKIHLNYF